MSVLALLVECGDAVTKILFEKEFPKQAMMSRQIKVQDQYSLSCKGHSYTLFLPSSSSSFLCAQFPYLL